MATFNLKELSFASFKRLLINDGAMRGLFLSFVCVQGLAKWLGLALNSLLPAYPLRSEL